MKPQKTRPASVDEYIEAAPEEAQGKLRELRDILKKVVPDATEDIKWGSPVFIQKRILFSYGAFKSHINFMPTRTTLEQFKKELSEFTTGHDTIQLPYDKPLPTELIKKIAAYRVKEVTEENSLWMHKK